MALATATPSAMIAPRKDWMLIDVPVTTSASSTPQSTAGRVEITTSARPTDWKLAVSKSKIAATAATRPILRPVKISRMGAIWPRTSTMTPLGGSPARAIAALIWVPAERRSRPSRLAVRVTVRFML